MSREQSRAGGSWRRWAGAPYEAAARLRAWLYAKGWRARIRLPRPVVSVGNLTVGGTGKTPIVIYLVEQLTAQGKRVAVLSRGYRRRSRAAQLLVSDGRRVLVSPEDAGDEPYLIATRCPGAIVAVGADRVELGQWVLQQAPVDCFVLDDGFQHLRLHRDVDLLLMDASDLAGIQSALPFGRLREPVTAARRADAILITRAGSSAEAEPVWRYLTDCCGPLPQPLLVKFHAESFQRVGGSEVKAVDALNGVPALLFSGVGNAGSFHQLARALGVRVRETMDFRDHAHYTAEVVDRIRQRAKESGADLTVTTEKDAGKVAPFLSPRDAWWAVRLQTEIVEGRERLTQLLRLKLAVVVQEGRA